MEQKPAGIRIVPFAIAIVCFILPFIEISCDGVKWMSFTGVQLVTGSEMKSPMTDEVEKIPPSGAAVVTLVALAVGGAFCFSATRTQSIIAGVSGIVAAIAMVLLKTNMDAEVMKEASGLPVTVEYKVGFWGTLLGATAGALLAFIRVGKKKCQQHARQVSSEAAPSAPPCEPSE